MDRRTILGMFICVVFYIAYSLYLQKRYPDYGKPPVKDVASTPETPEGSPTKEEAFTSSPATSQQASPASAANQVAKLSDDQLRLESNVLRIQFDQSDAAITSLVMKTYMDDAKKPEDRRPVDLARDRFIVQPTTDPNRTTAAQGYMAERIAENSLRFTLTDNGWQKTLTYSLIPDRYTVDVDVSYKNVSDSTQELQAALMATQSHKIVKSSFSLLPDANARYERLISGTSGSRASETLKDYCENDKPDPALSANDAKVDFTGFDHHYFLTVFTPESDKYNFRIVKEKPVEAGSVCHLTVNLWQAQGEVKAGESVSTKIKAFFGPKDVDILARENPSLKETMDLGWFTAIGRPLLVVIKALNEHVTFNYGLAIILLTICLKILFYPLTRSAALSMKRMQLYTPEINKIKEKYKDDKQTQQKEMMAFLAKHKINPAKGCLPILPQIPVFIAFYNVLSQSIDLRHAPFFGWIQDLSASDPYLVTPILLGIGMFIQQKLTPNPTMDKTQERIMLLMPIMFTFMMLSLPAGMVLYMITNTIVSILQQQWLNKRLKVQPVAI